MEIKLHEITVAELVDGYADNAEEGVVGYSGRLDIRPPYQREFVYDEADRAAVIDTLHQGFPLNVMYWAVREDGNFEIIDGQQRTISICQFALSKFSCTGLFGIAQPLNFTNLQDDQQEKILNYKLTVYLCTGSGSEKLAWFKTINIAGKKLTGQELLNAVYSGPWVTNAKRYFSKTNGPAHGLGSNYLSGRAIRQEYLETAIAWIAGGKSSIESYMSEHQHDANAEPLWEHFRAVIEWVQKTFPTYRKEMKGLDWGSLYAAHKERELDSDELETRVAELMEDDEIKNKRGIYEYVLTDNEKHLNLRTFSKSQKRAKYEQQKGKCANKNCADANKKFDIDEMEADHITPWSQGGKTNPDNCQMLCRQCNREKAAR